MAPSAWSPAARHVFEIGHSPGLPAPRLRGAPTEGTPTRPPGRLKLANRGVLAGALVQQCLAQHADRVQFHFEQVRRAGRRLGLRGEGAPPMLG